jgi:hypothetical protein
MQTPAWRAPDEARNNHKRQTGAENRAIATNFVFILSTNFFSGGVAFLQKTR